MFSLNKVTLIGRVGQDPEIRNTDAGVTVMKFSLVTESYNAKTKESKAEWHTIVAFNPPDFIQNAVKKGTLVNVNGRISYNKYEKDGETKYYTQIIADGYGGFTILEKAEKKETEYVEYNRPERTPARNNDGLPF